MPVADSWGLDWNKAGQRYKEIPNSSGRSVAESGLKGGPPRGTNSTYTRRTRRLDGGDGVEVLDGLVGWRRVRR